MRVNRLIRFRGRKKKLGLIDLDITSLLDILVIMLVFLLKSYNSSGVVLNVPKGVTLPISESQAINSPGVIVQVSPTTIWVDDNVIFDINKSRTSAVYDQGRKRIIPLFNELVKKRKIINQVQKSSPEAKKFSGIVNLIVDKSIRYSYLKKLLHTCAEAGFIKYKFIVLNESSAL